MCGIFPHRLSSIRKVRPFLILFLMIATQAWDKTAMAQGQPTNGQTLEVERLQGMLWLVTSIAVGIITLLLVWFRWRLKALKVRSTQALSQFQRSTAQVLSEEVKAPLEKILHRETGSSRTRHKAQRMLTMVNNVVEMPGLMTSEVTLELKPTNFFRLAFDAIEQVRPLLSKKEMKIKAKIERDLMVQADARYLLPVLVNLLTQAIKISPSGSVVNFRALPEGGEVLVVIKDQGQKMATNTQGDGLAPVGSEVTANGIRLRYSELVLVAHQVKLRWEWRGAGNSFFFTLQRTDPSIFHRDEPLDERSSSGFVLAEADRKRIAMYLPQLKALEVYEAIEIEALLDKISLEAEADVSAWVDSVLNAAYEGDQMAYEELLSTMEV
ncbi:MAG TPA: hypothetical protein DCE41_37635 [Cytophagales bacterium]|nr:hypothetical protein [Cytophagales bacterium]HAA19815.1 hypothetical protein [Cytophagales bacterium]HAP60192.1 hypothetical protein [Cytophagales bacterium]